VIESWCKAAAAAGIGACVTVTLAAAALTPPAVDLADRYLTLAAILSAATVLTSIAVAAEPLDRARRLLAVVLLSTIASAWYAGRLRIHEKQFDDLVRRQKIDFELSLVELGGDIVNFERERGRRAPPPPAAATWDDDENALLRYEDETAMLFERDFGPRVRKTHDLLALEGIRDRDFDAFYRGPANAFQIHVVAEKLIALARRLERS
jgi:hypothetical protein